MIDSCQCSQCSEDRREIAYNNLLKEVETLKNLVIFYIRKESSGCAKPVENLHYIVSDLWQDEFFDIIKVLEFGAKKHGKANWLERGGKKSNHKDMHDSMFHHLSESFAMEDGYSAVRGDRETGLDPLLHLACRALMCYTRKKRGLE